MATVDAGICRIWNGAGSWGLGGGGKLNLKNRPSGLAWVEAAGDFHYNYFGTGNRMLVGQAEYRRDSFGELEPWRLRCRVRWPDVGRVW